MHLLSRRILLPLLAILIFLSAGAALQAYPVNITINVTFRPIAGQSDPLGLGTANPPLTASILATIDSSTPMASYPATVSLTLPAIGLVNSQQTGTLSIAANGQITASFSAPASGSFNAILALQGVTFPNPVPLAFGTASFSAPASSTHYTLLGQSGVVGISGTISAVGLTASPASISAIYTVNGSAPAPQQITVSSNDPAHPALSFTAVVANASAPFVTLSSGSGTTPGTVTATFSTSVAPGNYTAAIQINQAGTAGAPISIPVTYTVQSGGGGPSLQISPSSLSFQFFVPGSTTSETQSVAITSSGGAATYTASVANGTFLTVSPSSGSIPGTINVTANAAALAAGTFSGSILLSSPALPSVTIPVTVTKGQNGPPQLTLSPSTLQFTYVVGAATPAAQPVTVSSAFPVTFTVTNQTFYLPVTPASGTTVSIVSVGIDPAQLTPGNYTDVLAFQSATGSVTSLPVTVTVTPGALTPPLSAAPATLSFTDAGPLSQTVAITSGTGIGFTASTAAPWLSVTPQAGRTPGSITVTANATGLAIGSYTGSITLSSAIAGSALLNIPVTFTVTQVPPQLLSASPSSLAFAYQLGGTAPAAQTVTLTGPAGSTFTASGIGANWLAVAQSPDLTTATVTVVTTNLSAGTYAGSLKISAPGVTNSPLYVPLTLTVAAAGAAGLSPSSLTFSFQPGGSQPAAQTIAVAGSDATAFTVTSDAAWLTAAPASLTTPGTLTVTAAPGSMAAGVYQTTLTLTSPLATLTVPVTLGIGQTTAPVITAVSNGISYENALGAPGLIVAIWGTGLGSSPCAPPMACPVAGSATQVFTDGIPSPVLFASPGQVNAVLPFSLDGQASADVQLFTNGAGSNVVSMTVQAVAPSLFTSNAMGNGGGAILNQDLSLNSASNPAAAGDIVAIYGGGGGQMNPPGIDGLLTPVVPPFPAPALPGAVLIGGQPAPVSYYGAAPGLISGVLQINAMIPLGTAAGPQPVVFSAGGINSQPNVVVYVK